MPEEIAFIQHGAVASPAGEVLPSLEGLTSYRTSELRSALERLYISFYRDPDGLGRYLAPTCVQHLGLRTLDYMQILAHLRQIRAATSRIRYSVVEALSQQNTIADRHVVELTSHDTRTVQLEVFCFLRLAQNKVVEVWESVQVLDGDPTLVEALAKAPG